MAKRKQKTDEQAMELESLQQRVGEVESLWKRAVADYQNLQKRTEEHRVAMIRMATAGLMKGMIPIVDDLERAHEHLHDLGVEMVLKAMKKLMTDEGVELLDPAGEVFDPQFMDCEDVLEGEQDKVIRVVQKGYRLGDTVLRPARVLVGSTGKQTAQNASIVDMNLEK